jgi:murein DD-endopeptidase MepM/ murein hydrolase activator NlpD
MRLLVMLVLVAPVDGEVSRGFDPGRPFEGGRHRGVDLAGVAGGRVRAACGGPVAFAGRVGSSGGVVVVRCGGRRVTHMPLATIAVRAGATVRRGAPIGTLAASPGHAGLHLGVRREGTRFGYEDPLRFFARRTPPVPLGRAPRPPRLARPPRPPRAPGPPRLVRPPPRPFAVAPRLARPVRAARPANSLPVAPWPAWVGLALVLAGARVHVSWRRRACSNPELRPAER